MADAPPDDDTALAELLDSALADFESPKAKPSSRPKSEGQTAKSASAAGETSKSAPTEPKPADAVAADLLGNLQQLYEGLQAEGKDENSADASEFMAQLESQMGSLDSAMRSLLQPSAGDDTEPGMQEMKTELRRLVESVDANDPDTSDGAQNIWGTMQETLAKLNADLPESEAAASSQDPGISPGDPLAPFMEHMLGALLSRDVLYVPLKGIVERYPEWLDANTASLPADKVTAYRQQLRLMRDVCNEFEASEAAGRAPDTMKVFGLVQRMQELGPPPEALVGPPEEGAMPAALGADPGCPTM